MPIELRALTLKQILTDILPNRVIASGQQQNVPWNIALNWA